MNRATVYRHHADGRHTATDVRNLGWLIRHAAEVSYLVWVDHAHSPTDEHTAHTLHAFGYHPGGAAWHYVTPYASRSVFDDWKARSRTLRDVRLDVIVTCSPRELATVNTTLYGD